MVVSARHSDEVSIGQEKNLCKGCWWPVLISDMLRPLALPAAGTSQNALLRNGRISLRIHQHG